MSTETETEVESTSAISSEVQPLSQNPQNELVWPVTSFEGDDWGLEAEHSPDRVSEIAVWRSLRCEILNRCVIRFFKKEWH